MWRAVVLGALAGCLLVVSGATELEAGTADLQGDADCSGQVNPVDALVVLRQDAGNGDAPCAELADVQCDGDVDPIDALQLLRFDAGLGITQEPGCAPIGAPAGPPPASEELIAAALDAGDIDYEESLLYRAYALYDHPDLPDEFRSEVMDYHAATALFAEVLENEGQLSQQLLDELAPFRARPSDPVSIFNNPPQGLAAASVAPWVSMPAAGGMARVWVRDNPGVQLQLQGYVSETTRVWDALPGIFRYGLPDTPGDPAVNPDSAIDLYFADIGDIDPRRGGCDILPPPPQCVVTNRNGGFTGYVAPFSGHTSASYVVIDFGVAGSTLTSHIAHELVHTGQHAYDVFESVWLKDATATWGAVKVLQKLNVSRQPDFDYLPKFFQGLDKRLTRETQDDLNQYGSWLFFLFASMEEGDGIVTQIWENAAASGAQNERAVNNVFPFDVHFDDFTVRNWNDEPVDPLYRSAEGDPAFPESLAPNATSIHFGSPDTETLEIGLEPLSAEYQEFTFDDSVRTVVFDNKWVGEQNWHVWALTEIDGEWKEPEDWSDEPKREFCRDRPSENLTNLVLIVSNSHMTNSITPPSDAEIEGKSEGCSGWEGWVSVEGDGMGGAFNTPDTSHNGHYSATTQGLRFEQDPDAPLTFELTEGSAHWVASGTRHDGCGEGGTVSGEFNVDFATEFGREWFFGKIYLDPFDETLYGIYITTNRPPAIEVWDCPFPDHGASGEHPWFTRLDLIPNVGAGLSRDIPLKEEGGMRVAEGEFTLTQSHDFDRVTYRWRFVEFGPDE